MNFLKIKSEHQRSRSFDASGLEHEFFSEANIRDRSSICKKSSLQLDNAAANNRHLSRSYEINKKLSASSITNLFFKFKKKILFKKNNYYNSSSSSSSNDLDAAPIPIIQITDSDGYLGHVMSYL